MVNYGYYYFLQNIVGAGLLELVFVKKDCSFEEPILYLICCVVFTD